MLVQQLSHSSYTLVLQIVQCVVDQLTDFGFALLNSKALSCSIYSLCLTLDLDTLKSCLAKISHSHNAMCVLNITKQPTVSLSSCTEVATSSLLSV